MPLTRTTTLSVLEKLKEMKINDGFVVVHVWRPRQKDGKFRTAFRGVAEAEGEVGHVTLSVFMKTLKGFDKYYVSFWPSWRSFPLSKNDTKGVRDPNGSIGVMNDFEGDIESEGRFPDVSIPLFNLDMASIVRAVVDLKNRTNADQMRWYLKVPLDISATSEKRNCGTSVWNILQTGGINRYKPEISGPTDNMLRSKYLCDNGRLLWGWFDAAPWRKSIASPVLVLHLVASAREKEREKHTLTKSLEDMVLSLYPNHVDSNNPIVPVNEFPDTKKKKSTPDDTLQMLIPFSIFGNQIKKAVSSVQNPMSYKASTHWDGASQANSCSKDQAKGFNNSSTLFYSSKFSKHFSEAINILRRVMR